MLTSAYVTNVIVEHSRRGPDWTNAKAADQIPDCFRPRAASRTVAGSAGAPDRFSTDEVANTAPTVRGPNPKPPSWLHW